MTLNLIQGLFLLMTLLLSRVPLPRGPTLCLRLLPALVLTVTHVPTANIVNSQISPDGEWTHVHRQGQRRQRRNNRYIRQLALTQPNQPVDKYFVRYYTIQFPGIAINSDLNILQVDTDLNDGYRHTQEDRQSWTQHPSSGDLQSISIH